ncbi:hypothetical protein MFLAVUS_006584 [Mucor flavus]|uniref:Uncharacterized protein n=1 Tax=Mucor flavus TaxID=439312 RepID=A0ABP9Z1Y5_9FUNG
MGYIDSVGDKIRLWSIEQSSPGVYVTNLVVTATIPTELEDAEVSLRELAKLLWTLKCGLHLIVEKLNKLAKEHKAVEVSLCRENLNAEEAKITTITSLFEKRNILKIKGDYIPDCEELQVHSTV